MTSTETPKSLLRDYFETIATCVIFVLFARTFVFQQSKIPTGSMIPTLLIGDYIMVNKFVYSPVLDVPLLGSLERTLLPTREVARGDVVVFKFPQEPEKNFPNLELDIRGIRRLSIRRSAIGSDTRTDSSIFSSFSCRRGDTHIWKPATNQMLRKPAWQSCTTICGPWPLI